MSGRGKNQTTKGRIKKKPKEDTARCKECDAEIATGDNGMECDLCDEFVCLECTEIPEEVYDILVDKDVEIPFICTPCKADLPKVKELMGLKQKYNQLNEEITKLRADLATQELKSENQAQAMNLLTGRLEALERNPTDFPNLLDTNEPHSQHIQQFVNNHVRPVLQNEISEFDKIQAIKKNLVCSGIEESTKTDETEAEAEDRTTFINLIKDEFNLVADVERVERCGKKKPPSDGDETVKPRLLKIFMKDFRTRKLILSKAVTLRNSENEYTKDNVYIRPDQTLKQQEESKNLRDQLKLTRQQNTGKTFKIQRGKVVEVVQVPAPEPAQD